MNANLAKITPVPQHLVVPISERATSLMLSAPQWKLLCDQCEALVASHLLPLHIDTPQKAAAIALYGFELGVSPFRAWQGTFMANGNISLRANFARSLIYERAPGATVQLMSSSDRSACWMMGRPGQPAKDFVFTIQDAQRAKLLTYSKNVGTKQSPKWETKTNENWAKRPRNMLVARAFTEGAWVMFADVLQGSAIMHDFGGGDVTVASPSDGSVVDQIVDDDEDQSPRGPAEPHGPQDVETVWRPSAARGAELPKGHDQLTGIRQGIGEITWTQLKAREPEPTEEQHRAAIRAMFSDLMTKHLGAGWEGHRPTAVEAQDIINDMLVRASEAAKL